MQRTIPPRAAWADALRVFSAFAVVWLHVSATRLHITYNVKPCDASLMTIDLFRTFPSFAVPCFFMISGYFFLDPARPLPANKLLKSCLRLLAAFAFWSLLYAAGFPHRPHVPAVSAVFKGPVHLWFLPALASCYLAVPLLRAVVRDSRTTAFTLCAAAAMVLLPQTLREISPTVQKVLPLSGNIAFVSAPVFYFLAGGFAATGFGPFPKWRNYNKVVFLAGVAGLAATFALTVASRVIFGRPERFLSPGDFFVAVFSIVVFLSFKALPERHLPCRARRWLRNASGLTFGIYLMHPGVLGFIPTQTGWSPWLGVASRTATAFVVSALATAAMKRIPVLRKVV